MQHDLRTPVRFGATGLVTSRLAIASSYGVGEADVERAFDRGIRFFFWGAIRRPSFGRGVRNLAARSRERMVVAIQSYDRTGFLGRTFVESALRRLGIDRVDLLVLSWWSDVPARRVLDLALRLRDEGKVGHLMVSSHQRTLLPEALRDPAYEGVMVRYNAAHPGAEREVFPLLGPREPGVLSFTATRWGSLLDPRLVPDGEPVPTGSDCYRFVLSNPHVHATLCGPRDGRELDEALRALDRGPMDADELAWMRRVGAKVRADTAANRPVRVADRVVERIRGSVSACGGLGRS